MSRKNSLENKKMRRLERALRKGRLPRWLSLVDWCKDHGHAQTAGAVRKLIQEDRIRYASHPLGKKTIDLPIKDENDEPIKARVIDPRVPAHLRNSIVVHDAQGE